MTASTFPWPARRTAALATVLAACAGYAAAATLHVPGAFPTIQAALTAAQPGDVIVVADGVYSGPGNVDLDFDGKALTLRSAGGPAACIILCTGTPTSPQRGFYFHSGETPASVVDGFTVRGGTTRVGAIDDQFNGGAILCNNASSPTIRNCILEDNSAACWGGAICCTGNSHPTIVNCIIRNNLVGDDGAALFAWNSSYPRLINCLMTGNHSNGTGAAVTAFNGAVGGALQLRNCTIAGNSSNWMTVFGHGFEVVNCILWNNSVATSTQIYPGPANLVRYTIIEGGHTGAGAGPGVSAADPRFVSAGDYRLAARSPAIDAGDNLALPADLNVDVLGGLRFMDDPGVADGGVPGHGAPQVDLGAVEFAGNSCPGDTNGDRAVDLTDLATLLSLFGSSGGFPPADVDRDADVDLDDLTALLARFGSTCE